MIETFLLCLIAANLDCTTLHPDLSQLIPRDLLPPDNLFHPLPVKKKVHCDNNMLYMDCKYVDV